ncbi:receptor-like protein kinase 7 isoform X1 [Quercus robur]|uniref:receptor-like protein kinase 7 isoform X1 n=1 Tax=Quercus robur TaxID=38942 RepID=UPI0021638DDB|nr:receptor-like protein kinase 7 isoform X1 [Quercus robur]
MPFCPPYDMSRPPLYLFYLLFCFFSLIAGIQPADLQILMKLKSALQTSNGTSAFKSWESSNSMCNFTGITCNSDGSVTEIELSRHNLTGVLPLDSICQLQSLEKLSFGFNNLHGPIMDDLNNCVKLLYLDLGNNLFLGWSAPDISSLSQLQYLFLNRSGLSGSFPWKSLQNMTGLVRLSLGHNLFNPSPFPNDVLQLANLTWIHLSNCSIQGTIPAEIGNLKEVINLELSCNNMTGEIPVEIGNLVNLWQLDLSNNSFTGKLPVGLRNLSKLERFDVTMNYIEGDVSVLRFLSNLVSLELFANKFSGQLPAEFGEFKKLVNLTLNKNNFTGPLPQNLGSWAKVEKISVSYNFFTGPIPPDMCKQGTIKGLYMHHNNLTGEIPANFVNCSTLLEFRIDNNLLSGTVPAGIWGLPNLLIFDISFNSVEGPITSDIKHAKSLVALRAENNRLSGELPAEISEATSLVSIRLNDNLLQGKLLIPISPITFFGISNNRLTGEIPYMICNVSFLKIFDVSNNSLSGKIPQCLGNFSNHLWVLNLQMNDFHGPIPDTFAKCHSLELLVFNDNHLGGLLPKSLLNCTNLAVIDLGNNMINDIFPYWLEALPNLEVLALKSNKVRGPIGNHNNSGMFFSKLRILDLGNNKINDFFPYWLEALPNLQILVLKSNRFHGPVGNHNTRGMFFSKLQILDLSFNEFTGFLPKNYFENLNTMMINDEDKNESQYFGKRHYYQDSVVVTIKNIEIKLPRILTIFTTIDLSSNKFEGEIPEVLGRLTVLRLLNLSHNNLTNHIPPSLANMSRLESLDLSSNRLTGQIPIQLTSLTFLAMINLSRNQLTGPIPEGKQFGTFENDSYEWNLGLCGFPLSMKCNTNELLPPPPLPSIFQEDKGLIFASGFDWKVVLMGYGCGFLFGITMGCIAFKRGKTQWLIRFIEGKRKEKVRRCNDHRPRKRRN